ncbi:MAG TPA: PKD domain-containing protein, partial [Flavisolibacter sp.]|nr:PKD domain-containing protein [Flavisolibacter sp.]
MKTRVFLSVFVCFFLFILQAAGQDFSNKGKDFWVGYGLHCRMFQNSTGGTQQMVLYFATEAVTTVKVEIPALGYSQTYANIPANTIFTSNPLPKNGVQDARLTQEGISNKGIHITSDKPIVAYAHIYNGNVSGATLLFPTATLGKEYYSINFTQNSNEPNSNSFFYAVATDTGTTTVEVVPSRNTQGLVAGNTYTFNLTQGQVLNVLGQVAPNNTGVDLTGSRIRSISTATGVCKRIAVFSGSGKINISCPLGQTNASADNYMVQAFPKNAWGKYYLTAPTNQMPNNYFRIAVSDPTTVVKRNGFVLSGLIDNFYYQLPQTASPNLIEADKPIMVAQYITSSGQCGNNGIGNNGDPEVIYLSPVEQNLDKVIINSTGNSSINSHFVNLIIPNGGTAISSLRVDGLAPTGTLLPHPQNPSYSYLVQQVSEGQHIIRSDSGFNAIAYGYGDAESYGYNAGANVKDLYQFVSIRNEYATVNFPAACRNSPFYFSMTFPYQPLQIRWQFGGLFPDVTTTAPVYDSTWTVNGRQLYLYKLTTPYTISASGTYPIKVFALSTNADGCSGEQEVSYDLQVFDRPVADFSFSTTGCVSDNVSFTDNTNTNGRQAIRWSWDFGNGQTASVSNPTHLFPTPGDHIVKYSVITDIGCISDTASKLVALGEPPVANFTISSPYCQGKAISFSDLSTTSTGSIVKWIWNFGDGSPVVTANTNVTQVHSYSATGTFQVTLTVENNSGCRSQVFGRSLIISPNPVVDFSFGNACLPSGNMQFTSNATISDGSQSQFAYFWRFGDGGTATASSPSHSYTATGPYNATLVVTSGAGCADSITRQVNTIYAQPQAAIQANAEVCLGAAVSFTDATTATGSSVAQWSWNFGDGNNSSDRNPSHTYAAAGSYTVTLNAVSAAGCPSTTASATVVVNALPAAGFTVTGPVCAGGNTGFTDASSPGSGSLVKWTWNMGDGNTQVRTTGALFNHVYPAAGTYPVSLQVETDKGCVSTLSTQQVAVNALPVAAFNLPDVCLGDPVSTFTDASTIPDGTGSQFTYLWNFNDPNATPANPNTSTQQNGQHKYTATGPYNVSLTVTSNKGCTSTVTREHFVNGSQPLSVFTVSNNLLCSNEPVSITDNSTLDVGRLIRLEIFWDYTSDPTIKTEVSFPVGGTVYTHAYPEFFSPSERTVEIRVVAYSGASCLNTSSKLVTLKARPELVFDPITGVCADVAPFGITQARIVNGLAGTGVYSGPGISSGGLFSPSTAGVGQHTLKYTFSGSNGCSNVAEQSVRVFAVPTATAGPDRFVLEGGNAVLLGSGTGTGLSYTWTPATGLDNPSIAQPRTTPVADITYTLVVRSPEGCSASDEVNVSLLKTPVIPNTFSPNGDGVHDRWEIKHLETYPGATVEIYNRYGQLLFRSVGYSSPWDGSFKGKQVPAGTYYYII